MNVLWVQEKTRYGCGVLMIDATESLHFDQAGQACPLWDFSLLTAYFVRYPVYHLQPLQRS